MEEIMKTMGLKEREYAAAVDKRGPGGYLEDRTEYILLHRPQASSY
jgi:hypothetical protein